MSDPRPSVHAMESYPVPFTVVRQESRLRLINKSNATVRWVRCMMTGAGLVVTPPVPMLERGESVDIVVHGRDLARESLLVVQWLRDDGETYLLSLSM